MGGAGEPFEWRYRPVECAHVVIKSEKRLGGISKLYHDYRRSLLLAICVLGALVSYEVHTVTILAITECQFLLEGSILFHDDCITRLV
jgi:hypothetical protein